MKKLDVAALTKALESQSTFWICPVTGKKFDSNDSAGIQAHKAELIQAVSREATLKEQQKELKKVSAQFKDISTVTELNAWFDKFIVLKLPSMDSSKVPVLSVEAIKPFKEAPYVGTEYALVKLSHVPHGYAKEFKKIGSLSFVKDSKMGETYLRVSMYSNPLAKKMFDYQKKMLSSLGINKVGLEERALLDKNSEYQTLKTSIKEVNNDLHELHEKHAQINQSMQEIRQMTIKNKVFEDSPTKSAKKKSAKRLT